METTTQYNPQKIAQLLGLRLPVLRLALFVWIILGIQLALMFGIMDSGAGKIAPTLILLTISVTLIYCVPASLLLFFLQKKMAISIALPQTQRFGWLIICGCIGLFVITWLILPYNAENAGLALIRGYVTVTLVAGVVLALRISQTDTLITVPASTRLLLVISITLAILLSINYVGRVPVPLFGDEPELVNLGWGVFTLRRMEWPIHHVTEPLLILVPFSIFYPAAGYYMDLAGVGVPQLRAFFLIIGWFSLYYIYLIGKHLYGKLAGIIAVAIAPFMLLSFTYARPDVIVVTMTSAALYFLISARGKPSSFRHYLVGFLVSFGIEGHPYAIRFILTFGLLYILEYITLIRGLKRWTWKSPFWLFVFGCLTYGFIFYVFHLFSVLGLSSPIETVLSMYRGQMYHGPSVLLDRILVANFTSLVYYVTLHPIELCLLIVGVIAAVKRRQSEDHLILGIFLVSQILGILFLTHGNLYYGIFDVPFTAILIGALLSKLASANRAPASLSLIGMAGACLAIVLLTLNIVLAGTVKPPTEQFIEVGRNIDALFPEDAQIVGSQVYWLGMTERRNFTLSEALFDPNKRALLHPDAMIVTLGEAEMNFAVGAAISLEIATGYGLKTAQCFYSEGGNEIRLFVREKDLPVGAPLNCRS